LWKRDTDADGQGIVGTVSVECACSHMYISMQRDAHRTAAFRRAVQTNDIVLRSNTEKVQYDGSFLPAFFNAEAFAALGLTLKDMLAHPEWFESLSAFTSAIM
jgi:hypothetical protein